MLNFLKNSNFLLFFNSNWPKTNLLTGALQKGPYFFETPFSRVLWGMSLILPLAPPKKFILCSGFDKICKTITTKSPFLCFETPQF